MIKELNSICRIAFLGVSVFAQSLTTFGRNCPDAVNWCDVSAYWENPGKAIGLSVRYSAGDLK